MRVCMTRDRCKKTNYETTGRSKRYRYTGPMVEREEAAGVFEARGQVAKGVTPHGDAEAYDAFVPPKLYFLLRDLPSWLATLE